jgi:pterin-4a-carbinolamine dehydratase
MMAMDDDRERRIQELMREVERWKQAWRAEAARAEVAEAKYLRHVRQMAEIVHAASAAEHD